MNIATRRGRLPSWTSTSFFCSTKKLTFSTAIGSTVGRSNRFQQRCEYSVSFVSAYRHLPFPAHLPFYTVFCYSSHYVFCFSYTTYFHIQIPNYLGDKHREEVIDRPARWDEVIFKCIPLQEGEEDTTEVRPQCISLFLPLT